MRNLLDRLAGDLRGGIRAHRRSPLLTGLAIVVLALGVAAASVSISIVNAFFVRQLPIAASDRFIHVYRQATTNEPFPISFPDYEDVRRLRTVFAAATAEAPAPLIMSWRGEHERVFGELVSDDYFAVLGVNAVVGRVFTGSEDAVVLSDRLWRQRFGANSTVLGSTLEIEDRSYRIVGVTPPGFGGTITGFSADLWLPLRSPASLDANSPMRDDALNRAEHNYFVMARLAPGATVAQARAALDGLSGVLRLDHPETSSGLRLVALAQSEGRFLMMRDRVFGASIVTVVVALLVTLVACANIAGLLLARAAARRAEIGVRLALGASRGRIISQLLAESASLAAAGGAAGILLAWQIARLVSSLEVSIARGATVGVDITPDGGVLAMSVALTVVAGVLCGLTPALESIRTDVLESLRRAVPGRASGNSRARRLLLVAQVAVSMLLLGAGSLFLRNYQSAIGTDLGFSPDGVVTAGVDVRHRGIGVAGNPFWPGLVERVRALPDVESAGLSFRLPLELGITRQPLAPFPYQGDPDDWPETEFSVVSPGYFGTVRIPLVEGRDFDEGDTARSPRVIIVNDVIASRFWPGQSAIGRSVATPDGERYEVVGVARRSKYFSVGEPPTAYVYMPVRQGRPRAMWVVARTRGDREGVGRQIRNIVKQMDPRATVEVASLTDRVRLAMAPASASASALGVISLLALLLTGVGLFGVVAQTVSRRTYEIGVRRALGASDWRVAMLVVSETAWLVCWGLALGLAGAALAFQPLRALLYDVDWRDPVAFGLAPLVLVLACLLAVAGPTWRAVCVSASVALRAE